MKHGGLRNYIRIFSNEKIKDFWEASGKVCVNTRRQDLVLINSRKVIQQSAAGICVPAPPGSLLGVEVATHEDSVINVKQCLHRPGIE